MLRRFLPLAVTALLFTSCASICKPCCDGGGEDWLAHDVYFDLKDDSAASCDEFVTACWDKLSDIDGIRFFASGTRVTELTRPVNDLEYDVSLHIFFESKAAHDAYQTDPRHLGLIEEFGSRWNGVRVFDSLVSAR